MKNNIENGILQIRKAYRLLFDYQTRILDLMSYIEGKTDFSFHSGWPLYSYASPKKGKGSLNLWSWDWLNFYYYHFHFGSIKKEGNAFYFGITHMADTGFFESQSQNPDKRNLKDYKNCEDSGSKLIFVVGLNLWEDAWGDNWNNKDFTNKPEGEKNDEKGGKIIFKSYDLKDFQSEESTEKILKDFQEYCKSKDIEFSIIERLDSEIGLNNLNEINL
jgi:hypothetical protein